MPNAGRLHAEVKEVLSRADATEPSGWKRRGKTQPNQGGASSRVDLVIAYGGHGTPRAGATALAGSGDPLAVLPERTGNLLVRNLGIRPICGRRTSAADRRRSFPRRVPAANPVVSGLAQWLPSGVTTKQVVLADGALKVAAGGLLAFGRFPRLSALALAGSLVPTTIAGHAFWKESDPAKRKQQRVHLIKNVTMLGGLLIAAVDTEGKPSLAGRARRAPEAVKHAAADVRRDVLGTTASAVRERLAG